MDGSRRTSLLPANGQSPPPPPMSPTNAQAQAQRIDEEPDVEMGTTRASNNTVVTTDAGADADASEQVQFDVVADGRPQLRRTPNDKLMAALQLSVRTMLSPLNDSNSHALDVRNPLFADGNSAAATVASPLVDVTGIPTTPVTPATAAAAHDSLSATSMASSVTSSPAVSARGVPPGLIAFRARKLAQNALPASAHDMIEQSRKVSVAAHARAHELAVAQAAALTARASHGSSTPSQ